MQYCSDFKFRVGCYLQYMLNSEWDTADCAALNYCSIVTTLEFKVGYYCTAVATAVLIILIVKRACLRAFPSTLNQPESGGYQVPVRPENEGPLCTNIKNKKSLYLRTCWPLTTTQQHRTPQRQLQQGAAFSSRSRSRRRHRSSSSSSSHVTQQGNNGCNIARSFNTEKVKNGKRPNAPPPREWRLSLSVSDSCSRASQQADSTVAKGPLATERARQSV